MLLSVEPLVENVHAPQKKNKIDNERHTARNQVSNSHAYWISPTECTNYAQKTVIELFA